MAAQLKLFAALLIAFFVIAIHPVLSQDPENISADSSPPPELAHSPSSDNEVADKSPSPVSSPPASSPSPSPSADVTPPPASVPSSPSPSPVSDNGSPPAPSPSNSSDSTSPLPQAPSDSSPSPLPAADEYGPSPSPGMPAGNEADRTQIGDVDADGNTTPLGGSDGGGEMSVGKKAGIAVGVFIGAGAVVLAGIIYKKRQDNIRRSQYSYATRSGLI